MKPGLVFLELKELKFVLIVALALVVVDLVVKSSIDGFFEQYHLVYGFHSFFVLFVFLDFLREICIDDRLGIEILNI